MLHAELTGGTARHAADRAWLLRLLAAGMQVPACRTMNPLHSGNLQDRPASGQHGAASIIHDVDRTLM
jgi:hypothetical protein